VILDDPNHFSVRRIIENHAAQLPWVRSRLQDEKETAMSTETAESTVILTELAAKEIGRIIAEQELDATKVRLRVGVKGGGCSGFSYILDLTETQKDSDELFEQHGIKMIVDPKSLLYLGGTMVDFKDEIMGRGFVFSNPNATTNCGCGSSFSF
jgi:iron-sulfur cluster assembly protein